jgi:S1-C subfamily serine protease
MRLLLACIVLLTTTGLASAWTVKDMNEVVDSTNFIVNGGCSGTLISLEHRLVLTNHHCINGGVVKVTKERVSEDGTVSKVQIEELRDLNVSQRSYVDYRLVGEATYKSTVVARWKESDLALLQIRSDIPHAIATEVFSGDSILRGETVYVVGNPIGLDASVTKGVISSTNRMFRVQWADAEVSFIQTDAGITNGNSGGALYNEDGELIGVPAAGARQGQIGLAIPYFRIQEFLTENCYGEVWDSTADSHDVCMNPVEEDEVGEE